MRSISRLLISEMVVVGLLCACCPCPTKAADKRILPCTAEEKAALTCFDFNYGEYRYKVQTVPDPETKSFPVKISKNVYEFKYRFIKLNGGSTPVGTITQSGSFTSSDRRLGQPYAMTVIGGTPLAPTLALSGETNTYLLDWSTEALKSFTFSVQTNMPSASAKIPTTMTIKNSEEAVMGSGTILGPTDDTPEWDVTNPVQTIRVINDKEFGAITCTTEGTELTCTDKDGQLPSYPSEDIKVMVPEHEPVTLRHVQTFEDGTAVFSGGDSPGCTIIRQAGKTVAKCY